MLSTPALLFDIHHDSTGEKCTAGAILGYKVTCPMSHGGNELAFGWAPRALTPELASRVSDPGWS